MEFHINNNNNNGISFLSNLKRYKGQMMRPKSDVQSSGSWTFRSDKVASESAFLVLPPCRGTAHTAFPPEQPQQPWAVSTFYLPETSGQ